MGKGIDRFSVFLALALAAIVVLLALSGCGRAPDAKDISKETDKNSTANVTPYIELNLTGVRVSEWYSDPQYKNMIVDIINFDNESRYLNATTICMNNKYERMPSNDSEMITLPGRSKLKWVPNCPKGTQYMEVLVFEPVPETQ